MTKNTAVELESKKEKKSEVTIPKPNFSVIQLTLIGTSPYVQLRFSQKARLAMMAKMEQGGKAKNSGKNRPPRDFDQDYRDALYQSQEGWYGQPASSYRNAGISACRVSGFAMTKAKLSVFIEPDGFDALDGTPLIRITQGQPERYDSTVRNETGVCDVRVRAMWREWIVSPRVRFDADQFTQADVVNLFMRVGLQVGIGEGRPDSKNSCGMGWGLFTVDTLAA